MPDRRPIRPAVFGPRLGWFSSRSRRDTQTRFGLRQDPERTSAPTGLRLARVRFASPTSSPLLDSNKGQLALHSLRQTLPACALPSRLRRQTRWLIHPAGLGHPRAREACALELRLRLRPTSPLRWPPRRRSASPPPDRAA